MVQAQAGVTDFRENMEALKHNFLLSGYFKKRGYEDSADLEANAIARLPVGTPDKIFTYSPKQLFGGSDSSKLHEQKSLNEAGQYLAANQFGCAVVVVAAGAEGDTQKEMVLTQARAMIIREYLVQHFGFDDSSFKTLGLGKQATAKTDAEWGTIQLLVFPAGCEKPADNK
jgi:outer membrane protein OmpA-like peptidoglycan-associated protein